MPGFHPVAFLATLSYTRYDREAFMIASIRMSKKLEKKLVEAAKIIGKSKSDLVRQAVESYCDQVLMDDNETWLDWWKAQNFPESKTGISDLSTNQEHLRRAILERAERYRS